MGSIGINAGVHGTVKATIMLLVCCQLSLVLALDLPASSHQNILLPHPRNSMDDTSGEEDILAYNAAPYNRYIAKREQLQIPNMDNYNFNERCALHRYTLMELHQMMEEEVKVFKECLAGNHRKSFILWTMMQLR